MTTPPPRGVWTSRGLRTRLRARTLAVALLLSMAGALSFAGSPPTVDPGPAAPPPAAAPEPASASPEAKLADDLLTTIPSGTGVALRPLTPMLPDAVRRQLYDAVLGALVERAAEREITVLARETAGCGLREPRGVRSGQHREPAEGGEGRRRDHL